MPLSAVDSGLTLTTGAGYYDLAFDTWNFGNSSSVSDPFNTFSLWPGFTFQSDKSRYAAAYYTLSGFSLPSVGDSWRIVCDNYRLGLYQDGSFRSMTDNAVPFISQVEISYSGTVRSVRDENTYFTGHTTEVIPFSSIFNGAGLVHWNKSGDVTLTFSLPTKNYIYTDSAGNESEWEWVTASVTSITFKTCYAINNANFNLPDSFLVGDDVTSQFGWDETRIYIVESESSISNESSVVSAGLQSVNTSINNLGSSLSGSINNVNNSVSQVKTQLTNATNTITTKIDTMSQDIQSGLQNVVESAQQNTQNIINTVTQKVDEVKTGITEVKDSIIDLPNKIQEMLIGLVVPDEETINAKYSEFDQLLSDRFGLIYQSADIIHDFADSFQTQAVMTADTGGLISLPSVTVNLAGTAFTFGGYEVDIIPDGFEQLQTAVRLAVSMVCTVVFVNMCKNKLEAILK